MRFLSALAFVLLLSSAASAGAAMPATRIVLITITNPSTGALSSGYTIAQRGSGSCWTSSTTAQRPDAWRCMRNNGIYDPCFAPATANPRVVYCVASIRTKHVFAMQLTHALPHELANAVTPTTRAMPWSIDLADGTSCDYSSGATGVVGGRRVNFFCSGGRVLLGDPDRSEPVWHIRAMPQDGGKTALVTIAAAYF